MAIAVESIPTTPQQTVETVVMTPEQVAQSVMRCVEQYALIRHAAFYGPADLTNPVHLRRVNSYRRILGHVAQVALDRHPDWDLGARLWYVDLTVGIAAARTEPPFAP